MADDSQPKRTISGIPDDYRGSRTCSHFIPKPFKPCTKQGAYLLTVRVAETANRQAHQMRYVFCEEHYPHGKLKARPSPPPDTVSAQEAANIIGISMWSLNHWRRQGRGPQSTKIGGRCWYDRQEVERWAEAYRLVNSGPTLKGT